jgi:NCS2 family nucleobase:cation symporter-2/xanthine permease
MKKEAGEKDQGAIAEAVHEVLPLSQNFILGLQHVLVMYSGAVAVPLMLGKGAGLTQEQIGLLVNADLLTCGIATLIQTLGLGRSIGIRLPLMMGVTIIALKPMISIGSNLGMQHIYGAILVSSLIVFLSAGLFGRLRKFFPPVVIGSIITTIGFSLIPLAMQWAGGEAGSADWGSPRHLITSFSVMLVITLITKMCRGFLQTCAILTGMVLGSVASLVLGHMDLSVMHQKPMLELPSPLFFGLPKFDLLSIISMVIVSAVSFIESTGVFIATGNAVDVKVDDRAIARGLRAEACATFLGSIFNSFPYITFTQNLGLVLMTRVKSRYVVATGGAILIALGLLPKMGAVVAAIPAEVLGGASLVIFGMVAVAGIRILGTANLECAENQYVAALSIGIGLGVSCVPAIFDVFPQSLRIIMTNGVIISAFASLALNTLLNYRNLGAEENAPEPEKPCGDTLHPEGRGGDEAPSAITPG